MDRLAGSFHDPSDRQAAPDNLIVVGITVPVDHGGALAYGFVVGHIGHHVAVAPVRKPAIIRSGRLLYRRPARSPPPPKAPNTKAGAVPDTSGTPPQAGLKMASAVADYYSSSGSNVYPWLSTTLPSCVIGT